MDLKNNMTFEELRVTNATRCVTAFKHNLEDWSLSDWLVAASGELGEACNIVKKLNRIRDGIENTKGETKVSLEESLYDELADTVIYIDLICSYLGVRLEDLIVDKFNRDSVTRRASHRLGGPDE